MRKSRTRAILVGSATKHKLFLDVFSGDGSPESSRVLSECRLRRFPAGNMPASTAAFPPVAAAVSAAMTLTLCSGLACRYGLIVIKDRPRRLDRIFSHAPIFFVTFCTRNRKRIDPLVSAHSAF